MAPHHPRPSWPSPPATSREVVEPRFKLWVERDGEIVLSDFRIWLLQTVAATGSLRRAAQHMGISYRRAWGKLRELESNLGLSLLRSTVGGAGGGATELTPLGSELVARYALFRERATAAVQAAFIEAFGETAVATATPSVAPSAPDATRRPRPARAGAG